MERLSFEFTAALSKQAEVTLVANRYGKAALPLFLPWAALRFRQLAAGVDVIHLGDPLLTCLLPFLPRVVDGGARRQDPPPVVVTIHGLDIRYPHPLYQALLRRFLPRVDLALCISRFVEEEMRRRFPTVQTVVMTPGVTVGVSRPRTPRAELARLVGQSLDMGSLLLGVTRLVPRKGIAWFVEHVLPQLPEVSLLVIGDGPERERILQAAGRVGVSSRVHLAGHRSGETIQRAYRAADLLVMPNLPVPGDAEGFGLVALEAASAGLPVVAARLEGITDAVVEGQTGILLPPGEPAAWAASISRLLSDPLERRRLAENAPRVIGDIYSWQRAITNTLDHLRTLGA